ncbi:MAG: ribonuclease J [Ruminococcaceae bacterium]|nr:ribonuclease J [Oscillospiraceae bacterium]
MSKLKIIPLGGLGEIGKNLTVFEYGRDIILIDCGLGFPDEELYGIDIVIPDITYLKQNKDRIRGIVITHGHEDHIGAIPYLISDLDVPIYATGLTAGIIELKLEEHDLLTNTQIFTKKAGDKFKVGCFQIEFINVNHSIADAVALAIKTPIGTVVHTGDFKIDVTPIQGEMIDLVRFGQLGREGVLALLSDSTNVEKSGYSISERKVADKFDELFKGCDKRIIVTTFASNIQRIQQIMNVAAKYNRKVAVTGRSMENMIKLARALEYMEIPKGVLVELWQTKSLPKENTVIISTGSQGESMSALYRMAFSEHKQVNIDCGDRVIISASAIPGNETTISRVIDELFHKGAEVIYDRHTDLHVSGHASQDEQKMMLALVKPKFFIPVHGEYRMLCKHAELAQSMGMSSENTVVAENGRVIEISKTAIKADSYVESGRVFVDGTTVGDVGSVVLRDRKHLAQDGMVVVVVSVSSDDHSVIAPPEILTRGFIYEKEAEALIGEMKRVVDESIEASMQKKNFDTAVLKSKIRANLSGYLYKSTRQSPMILPFVTEL